MYQRCRDLFGSGAPDRREEASPPPAIVRKPGCRGSRAEARLRQGMGRARSTKWPLCSRSCTLRSDIPGAFSGSAWPLRKSCLGCCVTGPRVAHGFRSRESRFSWLAVVTPTLPPYHKDGNPLVQSQGRTSVRFLLRPPTPIHLCFQLGNQFGRVSAEMQGSTTVGVVPSSSSAEPSSGNA